MTNKLMMGVTAFALIAGTGFALAQAGDAPIREQSPGAAEGQPAPAGRPAPGTTQSSEGVRNGTTGAATGQPAPAGRPAPGTTQSSEGVRNGANKEERDQHTR
jgi:hypothetical protein